MASATFRPDLTDYRLYIELLADRLNEDALYQKMAELVPDVKIVRKRRKYIKLDF
jgi:hypothetical protein